MQEPFHLALKVGQPMNTFYSDMQPALALTSILVVGRTLQMEKQMAPIGIIEHVAL